MCYFTLKKVHGRPHQYMNFIKKESELDGCKSNLRTETCCKSGDKRHEDNANLFTFQTMFTKEHNRIARTLAMRNPKCSDERVFQETRKIIIALEQKWFYNDWAPIALGPKAIRKHYLTPTKIGEYFNGYD